MIVNQISISGTFRIVIFLAPLIFCSCEDFLSIPPPKNQLVSANVFKSSSNVRAALMGVYGKMVQNSGVITTMSSLYLGYSSDELVSYSSSPDDQQIFNNEIINSNSAVKTMWGELYEYIYEANSIIEGVQSSSLPKEDKDVFFAEAYFIRALCYFHLVNLFGDVPIVVSTDYRDNLQLSRSLSSDVYKFIISDLKNAESKLQPQVTDADGRSLPTRGAVIALLARTYLYSKNWREADLAASKLIDDQESYLLEDSLVDVFLPNSKEIIYQLRPVAPDLNSNLGNLYVLETRPIHAALNPDLLVAFDPNDLRKIKWVDSLTEGDETWFYPAKYKVKTSSDLLEYNVIFRLSEQYLIRAEARSNMGDFDGAEEDINIIRRRAGLGELEISTLDNANKLILNERRFELFSDVGGHRWLDLRRLGALNKLMSVKPNFILTDSIYPIPQSEILANPRLLPQNYGY